MAKANGDVCGFVVMWDCDEVSKTVLYFRTADEARAAVREAERATHGNVSGTIHAVLAMDADYALTPSSPPPPEVGS